MEIITKISHSIGYVAGVIIQVTVASLKIVVSVLKYLFYIVGRIVKGIVEGFNRNR